MMTIHLMPVGARSSTFLAEISDIWPRGFNRPIRSWQLTVPKLRSPEAAAARILAEKPEPRSIIACDYEHNRWRELVYTDGVASVSLSISRVRRACAVLAAGKASRVGVYGIPGVRFDGHDPSPNAETIDSLLPTELRITGFTPLPSLYLGGNTDVSLRMTSAMRRSIAAWSTEPVPYLSGLYESGERRYQPLLAPDVSRLVNAVMGCGVRELVFWAKAGSDSEARHRAAAFGPILDAIA